MATNRVLPSILLATGVLLVSACASQPAPVKGSLDQKYFEREANNYQQYQYEGQLVYCNEGKVSGGLIDARTCKTEAALREMVEDARRSRNAVVRGGPQYVATVPGGSGT